MVTIAEFSIPTRSFALAEALPAHPDMAVEADRIAAHTPGSSMPCLWAQEDGTGDFETAIDTDPTVTEIHATADFDGERLYHIEWDDHIDSFISKMVDHQGVILEASARNDRWRVRLRFMTREQFDAFQTYFEEHGPSFQLEQLFSAQHPRHTRGDVTPEQHEALTTAADAGYFQVPRAASIRDLAAELGVSHQSVSERLRRGTENLVRDMLFVEPIRERDS